MMHKLALIEKLKNVENLYRYSHRVDREVRHEALADALEALREFIKDKKEL